MKFRVVIGLMLTLVATWAFGASWQLPSGYYVPAKMPMTVVNPRPDSETASWARNRLAYPDGTMQYSVPVAVQGGAYPFHYQLISGPPGMTIGADLTDKNYGIVTWTPTSAGGPYQVDVKVTDQQGNTVDATWSVTATTKGFVFIDPNAPAGGDGSEAHPFNNTMAVFGPTPTDATYSGYQIIFRGARSGYPLSTIAMQGPESNGNVTLQNNYKPVVWLAYTGDTVNLDFSHFKALVNSNQNDIWIQGLNIENARTDVTDYHFFYFSTNSTNDRTVFFDNNFSNIGYSSTAHDAVNQACILMFDPGVLRKYFTFVNNTLDKFEAAFLDLYAIKYAVIDNNKLLNGIAPSPEAGFYLKSDLQDFSVRRNSSLSQTYGYGAIYVPMQAQHFTNNNIEVAYNVVISGNLQKPAFIFEWDAFNGANSNPKEYVYRNTFEGWIGGNFGFPFTVWEENNVLIDDSGKSAKMNISGNNGVQTVIKSNNLVGTSSDGYIDADGNLTGSYASQFRGTHGHEITYGVNPLSAPTWN